MLLPVIFRGTPTRCTRRSAILWRGIRVQLWNTRRLRVLHVLESQIKTGGVQCGVMLLPEFLWNSNTKYWKRYYTMI